VGAATSLAEERVRGSLDILLSTPMSTRSILAGKWWGTFRQVGPVVFWPGLLGARPLIEDGNGMAYLLLIGSILAFGAAITSLGLALATWVSRLGRAVALCVTAYALISIGWPILIALLSSPEPNGRSLVMGSPAVGAFIETALISPGSFVSRDAPLENEVAASIWITIDLVAAAALFAATLSSFDRCLGRMPERGERPESVLRLILDS
jgi:ABC-type Na+ efflux pump permease subunit